MGLPANLQAIPRKTPRFFLQSLPQLRRATSRVSWLGFVSGAAVALVSAAAAALEETTVPTQQQRQPAGACSD